MEIADLKDAVEKLNGEPAPYLTGYFVFKGNPDPVIRQIDFDDEVSSDLAKKFSAYLKAHFGKEDIVQGDISTADGRQYDLLVYDIELVSPLNQLQVVKDNPEQSTYSHARDAAMKLDGFIFIIGNGDMELVCYKEFYPIELIKRDSYLVFGRRDSRFVEVADEIFKISNKLDFVLFEDSLIVLNLRVLENNLRVHQVLQRTAVGMIAEFNKNNILENPGYLETLISGDVAFARRVLRVNAKSPVIKLPFASIKKFISEHPTLKGQFRFNEAGTRIELTSKIVARLFMKLMDDDFLRSDLSQKLYDSIAKDAIET